MSDHCRFIKLNAFDKKVVHVLDAKLEATLFQRCFQCVVIDWLFPLANLFLKKVNDKILKFNCILYFREQIGHNAIKELQIILQKLGHVHVSDGSQTNKFLKRISNNQIKIEKLF